MTETIKKTKTAAKPRKPAAKKTADPVANHHGSPENHSNGVSYQPSVSHDEVAMLAHRFWKERGHNHGHHEEDWFRAEQELRGMAS